MKINRIFFALSIIFSTFIYAEDSMTERQILQKHFTFFYSLLAECKLVPHASFETIHGLQRCLTGVPYCLENAVFGSPDKNDDFDELIHEQLSYFNEAKMPFVWYLEAESDSEFKKTLVDHCFQDSGIFRGVIGILDQPIPTQIPEGCVLELVEDEAAMDEFNELVCSIFDLHGESKDLYKKILWDASKNHPDTIFHWIARKEGTVVSALSTLIEGNLVSFWNMASLPEMRRQGLSTSLCHLALKNAISRGCRWGASYLMSDGLAWGICSKLGYQTKWQFHVFISPIQKR